MALELLHFPLLQKVIAPALLRNQASIGYQLTHPDGRNAEDLSGFRRRAKSHHTQSCTTCGPINQPFSVHESRHFTPSSIADCKREENGLIPAAGSASGN